MKKTFRVGTRGSKLALTQTQWVLSRLRERFPEVHFETVIIKTKGDKIQDVPLAKIGGKGLFVKEIEEALLRGEIDFAVHSLKDVPSELPRGLYLAAFPPREDPRDALVSRVGQGLSDLPAGARVGTSSLRRAAQLRHRRPDLKILPLRGNVDTRLRKLSEGQYEAILLAEAGLRRLGVNVERTPLPVEEFLPAVGQGILAVEAREEDRETAALLAALHHEETALCARAERAFLHRLEGGCQVPLAAHARLEDGRLHLQGFVADPEGRRFYRAGREGDPREAEALGVALAEDLLSQGGEQILAELLS
ncbi:hydroxymethylbilane synthase [Thermosulfurimonas marina]|uniref:Porphobilinogen deaminase n=1 Tax=Thermosulfurimonas marina TaxID=2047767 RepID=A0A6H1WRW0_9BACT|nr:hydroxymethylbilane synthase [Thermosulfurimonas marina]QJA05955.1 hydroxymethylbilane synthase [Thermosulfurimonas marina]